MWNWQVKLERNERSMIRMDVSIPILSCRLVKLTSKALLLTKSSSEGQLLGIQFRWSKVDGAKDREGPGKSRAGRQPIDLMSKSPSFDQWVNKLLQDHEVTKAMLSHPPFLRIQERSLQSLSLYLFICCL